MKSKYDKLGTAGLKKLWRGVRFVVKFKTTERVGIKLFGERLGEDPSDINHNLDKLNEDVSVEVDRIYTTVQLESGVQLPKKKIAERVKKLHGRIRQRRDPQPRKSP